MIVTVLNNLHILLASLYFSATVVNFGALDHNMDECWMNTKIGWEPVISIFSAPLD